MFLEFWSTVSRLTNDLLRVLISHFLKLVFESVGDHEDQIGVVHGSLQGGFVLIGVVPGFDRAGFNSILAGDGIHAHLAGIKEAVIPQGAVDQIDRFVGLRGSSSRAAGSQQKSGSGQNKEKFFHGFLFLQDFSSREAASSPPVMRAPSIKKSLSFIKGRKRASLAGPLKEQQTVASIKVRWPLANEGVLLLEAGIPEKSVADIGFQEDGKKRALLQHQAGGNGVVDHII